MKMMRQVRLLIYPSQFRCFLHIFAPMPTVLPFHKAFSSYEPFDRLEVRSLWPRKRERSQNCDLQSLRGLPSTPSKNPAWSTDWVQIDDFWFRKSETVVSAVWSDPDSAVVNKFPHASGSRPVPCGHAYRRRALPGEVVNQAIADPLSGNSNTTATGFGSPSA